MDLDALAADQSGMLSRRQVIEHGGDDDLIERMVRRNLWSRLFPGTYLDHTGVPTTAQRHTAAVLYAWPAALAGESALVAHGVVAVAAGPVQVVVDGRRRVRDQPGLRVVRMLPFDERVQWQRSPPRLRLEDAVLQVASWRYRFSDEAGAVAVLADSCQQRRTTTERLAAALDGWPCLPGRRLLDALLADVRDGAYSPLEHRYLTRVERAHGLPRGRRQQPFESRTGLGYRDVWYADQGLVVELDGRLGHEWSTDRWHDLARDLDAATDGLRTIRLGWEAVARPCRLAPLLAGCLQSLGWTGTVRRCPSCP